MKAKEAEKICEKVAKDLKAWATKRRYAKSSEIFDKVTAAIKKHDKNNVLVITHGGSIRTLVPVIKKIPREDLPEQELKPGMMLMMRLPNGAQFPATIVEVMDNEVSVDFNHPLAGKNLTFEIELVEIG